jgi:uncharacterized membrane protein YhaH (DUF805 family)
VFNYLYYFFLALNNYANFKGRTSSQAWWMALWTGILSSQIISLAIQYFAFPQNSFLFYDSATQFIPLWNSFGLVCVIPFLSMSVRRFHDIGNGISGWWFLVALCLFFVFFLALIAALVIKGYFWLYLIVVLILIVPIFEILSLVYKNGSTKTNRFGPPANDLMPSNYQFVFTKNLKRCAIAFSILFIAIFVWDWLVVYEKVLPMNEIIQRFGK